MLKHIPLWFWRFWYPAAVYWWATWSHVYQALQVRAWHKAQVFVPMMEQLPRLTPEQVAAALARVTYRADGPRELWDAVGHPATIEHLVRWTTSRRADEPPPASWIATARDCDDFAQWAALRMSPCYAPELLAVAWVDRVGKPQGHVVCTFKDRPSGTRNGHVGNWGLSIGFASAHDMLESIYRPYLGNRLIGWSVLSPSLSVLHVDTGGAPPFLT